MQLLGLCYCLYAYVHVQTVMHRYTCMHTDFYDAHGVLQIRKLLKGHTGRRGKGPHAWLCSNPALIFVTRVWRVTVEVLPARMCHIKIQLCKDAPTLRVTPYIKKHPKLSSSHCSTTAHPRSVHFAKLLPAPASPGS